MRICKVSIVIPHLPKTREDKLQRLMDALKKQTADYLEIIISEGSGTAFKNNNKGWKKAKGNIIWFLADDVIPEPNALEEALKIFENEKVDGVEGYIYGKLNRIYEWGFMSGHIFYTKAVLRKIGGFDERFTGWRGDTDLAWTIIEQGGIIKYCPSSRVEHPEKSSTTPDIKAERLLKSKHPEMYQKAKAENLLGCLL